MLWIHLEVGSPLDITATLGHCLLDLMTILLQNLVFYKKNFESFIAPARELLAEISSRNFQWLELFEAPLAG